MENSYTNYDIMLSELDKIYMLLKPCELNINKISDIISKSIMNSILHYDLVKYFKINSDKIVVTNWWLEHINDWKFDDGLLKKDNYILFPFSNFYWDFQYKLANLLIDNKLVDKIYFLKQLDIWAVLCLLKRKSG